MYLKIPPCGCEILEVGWEIGTLDIVGALLTKASLKKWICAASNLNARIPSRLIRQMLANFFWSWILKECFKVQEKKILFPSSTKREIRQFHVVVVQRRQRNVQKSVMHVQSSCLAGLNHRFFAALVASRRTARKFRKGSSVLWGNLEMAEKYEYWITVPSTSVYDRPFTLRGHVTSFLWKWKLFCLRKTISG